MEAQYSRRGIGNLDQEVSNGVVTAVITNDGDDEEELWDNLKLTMTNSKFWKTNRFPEECVGILKASL